MTEVCSGSHWFYKAIDRGYLSRIAVVCGGQLRFDMRAVALGSTKAMVLVQSVGGGVSTDALWMSWVSRFLGSLILINALDQSIS